MAPPHDAATRRRPEERRAASYAARSDRRDEGFRAHVDALVATAIGGVHRTDPVRPRTGGPAGNARLTAWLGVVLLLLFVAECVTLISLHQLLNVHIIVGGVLVPLALAKTATTGWRIFRYYRRSPEYVEAGPPPLVLRLLGPLVVLGALAVLGTGVALIAVGADAGNRTAFTFAGFRISPVTLHQIAFVVWLVVTALHVLARMVPTAKLMSGRVGPIPVPGALLRGGALLVSAALAAGCGVALLHYAGPWMHHDDHHSSRFDDRSGD